MVSLSPNAVTGVFMRLKSLINYKEQCQVIFLEGYFWCVDLMQPLIGWLGIDIVCRRQCSDQSEARIPVTERYGILTDGGPGSVAWCLACIHQSECCNWY